MSTQEHKATAEELYREINEIMYWPNRIDKIERALNQGASEARRAAIEECASKCCSIDSSDISHETAESNAEAIRALAKEIK
jgi:hypothetical protein